MTDPLYLLNSPSPCTKSFSNRPEQTSPLVRQSFPWPSLASRLSCPSYLSHSSSRELKFVQSNPPLMDEGVSLQTVPWPSNSSSSHCPSQAIAPLGQQSVPKPYILLSFHSPLYLLPYLQMNSPCPLRMPFALNPSQRVPMSYSSTINPSFSDELLCYFQIQFTDYTILLAMDSNFMMFYVGSLLVAQMKELFGLSATSIEVFTYSYGDSYRFGGICRGADGDYYYGGDSLLYFYPIFSIQLLMMCFYSMTDQTVIAELPTYCLPTGMKELRQVASINFGETLPICLSS